MSNIERSIDVNVPVRTAYDQWTQFEEFPRFMQGVTSVVQMGDRDLRWQAEVGGKTKEWTAKITEQIPDERIAWRNTTGAPNAGVITFHKLDPQRTKLMLQVDYEPQGAMENIGSALGVVGRRIEGDLERFKEFIESRGAETGGWRGEVRQQH